MEKIKELVRLFLLRVGNISPKNKRHNVAKGMFVDADIQQLRNMPDVVLNGHCRAFLEYDGYTVARVVAKHTTKASINVDEMAIVTIDAYGDTKLTVATFGNKAQALIFKHGNAEIECIGQGIRIVEKGN